MPKSPPNHSQTGQAGRRFRIGIVGGMGPMAGVYLQQLIIEATPAQRDQDHLQVLCFTNPQVPERMRSLSEDGGSRYAAAVRDSALLLVAAGATHLAIPCNTAHARLAEIQSGVEVPILDMVDLGVRALVAEHGPARRAGLLATIGTLGERVYQDRVPGAVSEWIVPGPEDQDIVVRAILAIKAGRAHEVVDGLVEATRRLAQRGADVVVVGCTELSMCYEALSGAGVQLVDPLRVLARRLVELGMGIQVG